MENSGTAISNTDRQRRRGRKRAGGRLVSRDHGQDVGRGDEQEQRADEGQ